MTPLTPCARWTGSRDRSAEAVRARSALIESAAPVRPLAASSRSSRPLSLPAPELRPYGLLQCQGAKWQAAVRRCRRRPDGDLVFARTDDLQGPDPVARCQGVAGRRRERPAARRASTIRARGPLRAPGGRGSGNSIAVPWRKSRVRVLPTLQLVFCRDRPGSVLGRSGRRRGQAPGLALRQARNPGAGTSRRPAL